ncbi:SH3 domain-containing protein [Natronohydrobacter thiooxidans]|uniref:SH3 domain-containing protein n=1 Tax=Natronohydrobacter thiooxidans TaxID=87172 RepID=UPI0008FF3841|nr:SH3 domain-containing protein [Natronohydrobacter thiooxidans]
MKFKVTEDWKASYLDPICLQAGDLLYLTGRQDNWDGHIWLWAKSAGGLEGWIPDSIVRKTNTGYVATEDYTAAELTCRAGQVVTREKETHGWVFCRLPDGPVGWIPLKNLASIVG